jgi:hypothetical protein
MPYLILGVSIALISLVFDDFVEVSPVLASMPVLVTLVAAFFCIAVPACFDVYALWLNAFTYVETKKSDNLNEIVKLTRDPATEWTHAMFKKLREVTEEARKRYTREEPSTGRPKPTIRSSHIVLLLLACFILVFVPLFLTLGLLVAKLQLRTEKLSFSMAFLPLLFAPLVAAVALSALLYVMYRKKKLYISR